MLGSIVYTYLRSSTTNDSVYITNSNTNTSTTKSINCSDCSIVRSPNRKKALIWNTYSLVYIYSITTNFTQDFIFSSSLITKRDYTDTINFSSDSQLAIIETGG